MSVQRIHLVSITSSFGIMLRKAFIPYIKITSRILLSLFHAYYLFISLKF